MGKKWESLCNKCAICCHKKVIVDNIVYIDMDSWCEHLDPLSKKCKIYEERFKKNKKCKHMNIFRASFSSWLINQCGYVIWAKKKKIRFTNKNKILFVHSINREKDSSFLDKELLNFIYENLKNQ